jgi:membrane-bound lytic murein transglycosylase B
MRKIVAVFLCMVIMLPVFSFHQNAQAQSNNLTPEQEAQLRAELASIESQIAEQQKILDSTKQKGKSLEGDVANLNAQIKQAQLKIQKHEISINKLGKDITVKTNTIKTLSQKIDSSKESLAQVIQRARELDDYTVVEAMLSNQDISEFFVDLDSYANIKASLKGKLDDVRDAKSQTETAKKELDTKRNQEIDTKISVEAEKAKIADAEKEKKALLALNKNDQLSYQTGIQNKQKRAQEIKNALFRLRDAEAIKFGDAVVLAERASAKTGVRAAYILAIIQQESNLGANVGQCYLADPATGAGTRKSTGAAVTGLMKASRDVQPFLEITKALGRDPYKTVVSCPIASVGGYGGAMGPAQFIPSTWILFANRIASNVGRGASDPWNPEDAFMASGLYLSDLGASSQVYSAERNAACKYYSGRACSTSANTAYGNQVMARVESIQANMNVLKNL